MRSLLTLSLVVALVAGSAAAQCTVLTHFGLNNGQKGAMFDVENISANPITVTGFDQTFFAGAVSPCVFEIYTHTGGFIGTQSTFAAWTLVGTNPSLAIPVSGVNTSVPTGIPVSVTIAAGATQAFWLTCTAATTSNILYTSGPVGGLCGVMVTDGVLNLRRGVGKTYPLPGSTFGMTTGQLCGANSGRGWNGRVTYQTGATASFETNDLNSSLDVNGVQGTACSKAVTTVCAGALANFTLATALVGNGFDVAYNLSPTVGGGAGALVTPNGQLVNIDFFGGLFFLNGGGVPVFNPHPGVIAVGFGMAPFTISAQQIVLDPTHPDFFSLSQASQVTGLAAVPSIAGPASDDSTVTVVAGTAPLCMSALTVYGTVHTQVHVSSNAWVNFTVANNTFAPSVATFLAERAIGAWSDMNPTAGQIVINASPTAFSVNYTGVNYFGTVIPNTFSISNDFASGNWSISGLAGIGIHTGAQLVGMSPGLATDPGIAFFSPAGVGGAGAVTDALYSLGTGGSSTVGLTDITFSPNGLGNYNWLSL